MKKILLSSMLFAVAAIVGCNSDFESTYDYKSTIQFKRTSAAIAEDASDNIVNVTLQLAGPQSGKAISVEIAIAEGNVVEGLDYNWSGTTTVEIPANTSEVSFPVEILDNEEFVAAARTITFSLVSASDGLKLANEETTRHTYTITIAEDDCAVPSLVGTYSVVNRDASPAACGNPANDGVLTYTATITLVSDDGDGAFVYNISDVTGGLYALCYGDGENPGNISTSDFAISLVNQPDVVYGGDLFNGTGTMDCDGNFTLTWSNGYGDKGTSFYTKN